MLPDQLPTTPRPESTTGNYERTRKRMEELLKKARRKKEAVLGRNTKMWKSYGAANDRSQPYRSGGGGVKPDYKPLINFPIGGGAANSSRFNVNYGGGRQGTISHWSRGQNPLVFASGQRYNYAPRSVVPESTMHWSQLRTNAMGVGIGY